LTLGLSVPDIQTKILQTVELGIPENLLDNLRRISVLSESEYTPLSEDRIEHVDTSIEQELEELDRQLDGNPAGIWNRLNEISTKLLEIQATMKEKQPFIMLVFQIMMVLVTWVIAPAVQDGIKEQVLHVVNFNTENPAKNAREIKSSLSQEFDGATNLIKNVRVTNRETPVFRSNQRKSGRIDTIPVNKPVIIVHKKRNWCLIMYISQQQIEVTGWVYTGNLAK